MTAKRQKLRIVNYAVNGSGVGHLTRLVAINRWIRRYCAVLGIDAAIYFLTSSEADALLFHERFASFKLPSKTTVADAGIEKTTYLALAKQWVWHSLGLLRPDLLIVDSFPRGSFGELLSALDLCEKRAFIYRPMKDSFAGRADFQAMLPLYDTIVVPEDEQHSALQVAEALTSRVHHVGPVVQRETGELLSREVARLRLNLAEDVFAVYVSAGGGGDANAEKHLYFVLDALKELPRVHCVVAAGGLYRGRVEHRENVTWLPHQGSVDLLRGMDGAVVAAGYNTFHELRLANVPAIFLPQEKIADDQFGRSARGVNEGWAWALESWSADVLIENVRALMGQLQPSPSGETSTGARRAAFECLRTCVPQTRLEQAAQVLSDEVISFCANHAGMFEHFVDVLLALDPSLDTPTSSRKAALDVLRHASAKTEQLSDAVLLFVNFLRRVSGGSAEERSRAASAVITAFSVFQDWRGSLALLKVLQFDKLATAPMVASELAVFLQWLHEQDESLYQGIARLSKTDGRHATAPQILQHVRQANVVS